MEKSCIRHLKMILPGITQNPDKTQSLTATAKKIPLLMNLLLVEWWVRGKYRFVYHGTGQIAKHIVKRLQQSRTLPFFLWIGIISPHNPFNPSLNSLE
jgi:hypothetical protein